ncbi:MAG: hypothetical protein ABDH37_06270 [Candidatus Hydrothermales bacterium]
MKKLILLFIPMYLFSIEVKVNPGNEKYYKEKVKSERVYKVKRDTLDRDGDGIVDNFLKKMRDTEKRHSFPSKNKRDNKIPERGLRLR